MTHKNAITMRGTVDQCWLIAFRADIEKVRAILPPPLQPITYGGFAYLGIVVSHLRHMRPAPLPGWLGIGYWHAAYRVYAQLDQPNRLPMQGLWFLRSDADSALMTACGNLLTDFRFHHSKVYGGRQEDRIKLAVQSPEAPLSVVLKGAPALAPGSPFSTVEEAARTLQYAPVGFSVDGPDALAMKITRNESQWKTRLLGVESISAPFLDPFDAVPEVAYEVESIDYQWNRAQRYRSPA